MEISKTYIFFCSEKDQRRFFKHVTAEVLKRNCYYKYLSALDFIEMSTEIIKIKKKYTFFYKRFNTLYFDNKGSEFWTQIMLDFWIKLVGIAKKLNIMFCIDRT